MNDEVETVPPIHGRRTSDKLVVVDTTEALTKEELAELKQLVGYWHAGRLAIGLILALGALSIAVMHSYDFVAKWVKH